ncbi:MAG: aldo/keto reductase, partial [Thermoanaerobaculia bacterium]
SGKYTAQTVFAEDDRRHRLDAFKEPALSRALNAVARLRDVAAAHGKTEAQVAIRWVLDQPGVTAAVVGAKSVQQIESNAGAIGWRLSDDDLRRLAVP